MAADDHFGLVSQSHDTATLPVPSPSETEATMDYLDENNPLEPTVAGAAWRYRWLVVVAMVIFGSAAYAYAVVSDTSVYQALATMTVENPRSSILFENVSGQRVEDYVADQLQIIQSSAVAALAAEKASEMDPEIEVTTIDIFTGLEAFAGDVRSSLIILRMTADSERKAIAGVNGVIDAYEQLLRTETEASYTSTLQLLDSTIEDLNAEITGIQEEIQVLRLALPDRDQLDSQTAQIVPRIVSLQSQLATASDARAEEIRQEINDILRQLEVVRVLDSIEQTQPELAELVARQNRAINRIDTLSARRDQIQVDSRLLSSGVAVKTQALQAFPVSTNVPRTVAAGALLGLLGGVAIAYMLALRRRNFTERTQPELILRAPLIAEIPTFKQEGIKSPLPVRTNPRSASAEAFRFAAAALDLSRASGAAPTSGGKVVTLVSAAIGEGKTVVAANTALAAALEGSRVLLIDADFGNQMATALLAPDTTPAVGITEVVELGVPLGDAITPIEGTDGSGLHLLSRGWRQITAPEFFRLPATRLFLREVQEFYDLILVDGPPLLQVAYASTLAGLSDKVLVVVPHGGSLAAVEELQDRLDLIGTSTIGYVYNIAPLRFEMTRTEGSMKDVLGAAPRS